MRDAHNTIMKRSACLELVAIHVDKCQQHWAKDGEVNAAVEVRSPILSAN